MKLILTMRVEHDLLDVSTLLFALPSALQSVAISTAAGIQETGQLGIDVQVPGTQSLARVHFRLDYGETAPRMAMAEAAVDPTG